MPPVRSILREAVSEYLGTFCLVFAGAGALVVNEISGGAIGHAGIALTFGLVVMTMIYTFGDISGAHLNPAVTLGFALAGRFPMKRVLLYVGSQIAGAVAAAAALRLLFPADTALGGTHPAGPPAQSFFLEIILTAILMLVILSVSTGAREKGSMAGVAIGGVIGLEALFAGPVSGASMNPARSLGPAVLTGQVGSLWIYLVAPVLGAFLAIPLCQLTRGGSCCSFAASQYNCSK